MVKPFYLCSTKLKAMHNKVNTTELQEVKQQAEKVAKNNSLKFATIWETKTRKSVSYGFNFDPKEKGFTTKEGGVTRTVIEVLNF